MAGLQNQRLLPGGPVARRSCCQQIELSGLLANELSGFPHDQVGKETDATVIDFQRF